MFKEDGNVIHFAAPKGESQSDIQPLWTFMHHDREPGGASLTLAGVAAVKILTTCNSARLRSCKHLRYLR